MPVNAVIRSVSPARQSLLIAAVCLVVDVANLIASPASGPWLAVSLLVVVLLDGALALPAAWSGWVAVAFAAAGIGMAAHQGGWHLVHGPGVAGTLIVAYRAGAWLTGRPAVASLLVLGAGWLGADLLAGDRNWSRMAVGVLTGAALPWMAGRFNTAHRAYLDELRHQRDTVRRDAKPAVEKAVTQERSVIARDLHDVISHHVSAIAMHAGAARLALGLHPEPGPVADSLAAVEKSSRAAMADLRTMLDVLHGASDGTAQPGLDDLLDQVEQTRVVVRGRPRQLPESLDVALYRIGQEMLTNARRYGDGGPVEILLTYEREFVTIAARNKIGGAAARPGTARGLHGIRTRAAMFHGCVSHGPVGDGRWETTVTVPAGEAP